MLLKEASLQKVRVFIVDVVVPLDIWRVNITPKTKVILLVTEFVIRGFRNPNLKGLNDCFP